MTPLETINAKSSGSAAQLEDTGVRSLLLLAKNSKDVHMPRHKSGRALVMLAFAHVIEQPPTLGITHAMALLMVLVKVYLEQSGMMYAMVLMHAQERRLDYRLATALATATTVVDALQRRAILSFLRVVVTLWPLIQERSTLLMGVLDHTKNAVSKSIFTSLFLYLSCDLSASLNRQRLEGGKQSNPLSLDPSQTIQVIHLLKISIACPNSCIILSSL